MMSKGFTGLAVAVLLVAALAVPAAAFAGGDQVNRPDEAGYFDGGQQADGELPVWAPREQQEANSQPTAFHP